MNKSSRTWLGLIAVVASVAPYGEAWAETSAAELLLTVDRIVAPYALSSDLNAKRNEVVGLIVGAASQELQAMCRARNIALQEATGKQVCTNANYCPDMEIHVLKQSHSMSLNTFFATDTSFADVSFGFTVSWQWSSGSATLSTCYAPSIHPTILDLKQSLLIDPFFVNRIKSME